MRHPFLRASTLGAVVLLLAVSPGCSKSATAPTVPSPPQPLTVTSVSPTVALVNYPTYFVVKGTGFKAGAVVTLGVGTGATSASAATSLAVIYVLPFEGTVDLIVTNPDGESATLPSAVTFHRVSLTLSSNIVGPGGPLRVSWTGPSRESVTRDWIGLYRTGAPTNFGNELWWQYVTGGSGTATLPAPTEPGEYEVRYLPDDGEIDVARVTFTVL